ncbi:hypothetical protein [Aeromonas jandaei]|uniref:hypothetical protein n=1 Tax=Aeromonas jandaei TaxID=650 RepID=UPI003EC8D40F
MRVSVIYSCWLPVLLLWWNTTHAANLDITAEYKPATYEVGGAKFINTTPCTQFPTASGFWCSTTATVDTPQAIRFDMNISRTVKVKESDRDGVHYIGFPGVRDVTLVKEGGGSSYNMRFIISAVGSAFAVAMPSHVGIIDKGDCSANSTIWANNTTVFYFRNVNVNKQLIGGQCYGNNDFYSGMKMTITSVYLGYKLEAPNPFEMENGTYTGKLLFSMGDRKDFDFGNGAYADTQLNIFFKVKVRHQIKVDFPSNDNKVMLQPPGGWTEWIHTKSRGPNLLHNDLPFRIWFSAPFTVALRCQYPWSTSSECALKDSKGRTVPLKTYYVNSKNEVTLLTTKEYKFSLPRQGQPVVNAARAIRFQVVGGTVAEMMKYPGSSFKGDVTLIFDAAID